MRIELTSDEALVLFEFLERFKEQEALTIEDQAEQQALWNLSALLQKQLSEPFSTSYQELLSEARARVRFNDI